ncbi:MAG: polyprenyl synthetase family protein [Clostridia bacterium]|nr:polyprenyl synthetase family protein [Clostridia bacterium]
MKNTDELVAANIMSNLSESELSADMLKLVTSLWDRQKTGPARGGRFKWANLTFASCEAVTGEPEIALKGAVAMELYALAADIFDDIQDQDNRHSAWGKLSNPQAINLAICLLLLSFKTISDMQDVKYFKEISQVFNQTGLRACDGQYQEHLLECRTDVNLTDYLDIAVKKSGSLTGCACKIGAISGDASTELVEKLGEFGNILGIIAQIENDLCDILNPELKSDIAKRKKTLPLIYLMETLQGVKAGELEQLLKLAGRDIQKFGLREKEKLRNIVLGEGAAHYCLVVQEMFRQKAMELLEQIPVPDKQKGKLINLVRENT